MHKVCFVTGGHQDHVRQATHIGGVECARMGWTVRAHKARAINGETDGQILQGHIVHDLIVGALQKCRVNCTKRLHSIARHAGGKCYGVLFCNTNIKRSIGKPLFKHVNASARWHSRCDGHNPAVTLRLADQALAKDLGVGRRIRF